MAQAIQKITLSASRDIPFNKLMLSQSNVRRIKAGVSIEEMAEDTALVLIHLMRTTISWPAPPISENCTTATALPAS